MIYPRREKMDNLTNSGWSYCRRCGEQVLSNRVLCDECRKYPEAIVQVSINSTMIDAIAKEVAKNLTPPTPKKGG